MVRLKANVPVFTFCFVTDFNSKVVRLKVLPAHSPISELSYFNSKVVRLKGFGNRRTRIAKFYFNSKVVRLKVAPAVTVTVVVEVFQFQSGAVKSSKIQSGVNGFILFQFQSGAVKSVSVPVTSVPVPDFNSKVVRLKATTALPRYPFFDYFNSKVVRLKGFAAGGSTGGC